MDIRHVFAANLRRFRHEKGYSQEDLAYEANINRTYMSALEKGDHYVGLEIIEKLSKALRVEPADFLKPPPKPSRKRKTTST
jgi:transcriptional regulator with XRE-family HTH domain